MFPNFLKYIKEITLSISLQIYITDLYQGKEDDHVNFSKKICAFTLEQMSQTYIDTYTECACPHAYMSVFKSFFPYEGLYMQTISHMTSLNKELSVPTHSYIELCPTKKVAMWYTGKGHALSCSSRIYSGDKLRRCEMHSSRGSQHPQLMNQKVLSHTDLFILAILKYQCKNHRTCLEMPPRIT